MNKEDDKFDF